MVDVCDDPCNPLVTMATDDEKVRRADFGDGRGFVLFLILDAVVRVVDYLSGVTPETVGL